MAFLDNGKLSLPLRAVPTKAYRPTLPRSPVVSRALEVLLPSVVENALGVLVALKSVQGYPCLKSHREKSGWPTQLGDCLIFCKQ